MGIPINIQHSKIRRFQAVYYCGLLCLVVEVSSFIQLSTTFISITIALYRTFSGCIGKSARTKFFVITVCGSEFMDETERPKNQVMRAIERLSEAYIWENVWDIFAPVYF